MSDPGQSLVEPASGRATTSARGRAIISLVTVLVIAGAVLGIVLVLRGTSPTSRVARDYVKAYYSGDFVTVCELMDSRYRKRALAFVGAADCAAWAKDTRGKLNKAYTSSFGGTYDRLNADTTWKVHVTGTRSHNSTVTVALDVHGTYDRGDNARYRAIAGSKTQSVTVAVVQEKGNWRVASDTL